MVKKEENSHIDVPHVIIDGLSKEIITSITKNTTINGFLAGRH